MQKIGVAGFAILAAFGIAMADHSLRVLRNTEAPPNAEASRNSSGTMSAANGPYTSGTVISSSAINARFADVESEITDSLSRSGKGGMTAPLRVANGLVSAPSFSFTNDTGSGLYRVGSNDIGFAINGTKKLELTSSLFTVTPAITLSGGITGSVTTTVTAASGATANASSSMVIDSSGSHFLSLLGANANHEGILFGDVAGGSRGYIQYNNSADSPADTIAFGTGGSTRATISSSGLAIGSTGTAISASYRAAYSFIGALSAGTTTLGTVTVTGAAQDADCLATPANSSTKAAAFFCSVTSTNTVTVYAYNAAGTGSVTSSGYVRVFNP